MLEIRPNCEYCDIDLAANSADARICSYECTYCRQCVEQILHNVCPNCGGGFVARPIRPLSARREGVSLTDQPASTHRVYGKYSEDEISQFASRIRNIPPVDR